MFLYTYILIYCCFNNWRVSR